MRRNTGPPARQCAVSESRIRVGSGPNSCVGKLVRMRGRARRLLGLSIRVCPSLVGLFCPSLSESGGLIHPSLFESRWLVYPSLFEFAGLLSESIRVLNPSLSESLGLCMRASSARPLSHPHCARRGGTLPRLGKGPSAPCSQAGGGDTLEGSPVDKETGIEGRGGCWWAHP